MPTAFIATRTWWAGTSSAGASAHLLRASAHLLGDGLQARQRLKAADWQGHVQHSPLIGNGSTLRSSTPYNTAAMFSPCAGCEGSMTGPLNGRAQQLLTGALDDVEGNSKCQASGRIRNSGRRL